jgi:hypothetical protein
MTQSNRELLLAAARLLQPLAGELVFVGGSATGLMITDPASADARSTYDVDVIAEIASYSEYRALGKRLRSLGFQEDTGDGDATTTKPATIWKTSLRLLTVGSNSPERSRRRSSTCAPSSLRRLALCFALDVFSTRFRGISCPMPRARGDTTSLCCACVPLRHSDRRNDECPLDGSVVAGGLIRVGERLRERGALFAGDRAG